MKLKTETIRGLATGWLDNENEDGDLILFLHGFLDTPETWSAQMEAWGSGHRLLLPYARGVGPSSAPEHRGRYGTASILLDHLEILSRADPSEKRPLHVVGHDLGGIHAWMLACHPRRNLKSAVILNSVHPRQHLRRLLWPRQLLKSWYVGAFQIPGVSEALFWLLRKQVFKSVEAEGWRAPVPGLTMEGFEGAALNAMNQYRELGRDAAHFLREPLRPTDTPVLVIASEEDRYLEEPSTLEFSDIARHVTVRVVQGKHWLHREQPERINRLLGDFWAANRS